MGPRVTVPCPQCCAVTPAGLPRHITVLALTAVPMPPAELSSNQPCHIEARCPNNHEVHVYYERQFTAPPDG
jgi:hypothetical protein